MYRLQHSMRAFVLVALALSTAACGELVEQIQAEDVAIAALVKTPDQKKPNSSEVIPGIVTFQLFFGHLDKSKLVPKVGGGQDALAGAFQANKDALVSLEFTDPVKGPTTINVAATGDGIYGATSSLDGRLKFVESEYKLNIAYGGKNHRLLVTPGAPGQIQEFAGSADRLVKDWDVAAHPQGFTVTRVGGSDDPAKNDIAFVTLKNVTDSAVPEYSTLPMDPLAFLRLVLDDTPHRAKSFTIPQEQFKAANGYVVALTTLKKGESDPNAAALFLGSTFFAGVADGGGVLTK